MFSADRSIVVAHTAADIPERAHLFVPSTIAEKLGASVSTLFPEFAAAFPLTVQSMESYWSKPALAIRDMGRDWLAKLFIESDAANLFFDNPYPIYRNKQYFDVGMLPPQWTALYQSMSSFVLTPEMSYSPTCWRNTPLPHGIDVARFGDETGLTTVAFNEFKRQLEVPDDAGLRCWLITERLESLWINEHRRDGSVYHVVGDVFSDPFPLLDPGLVLDRYLSHVVARREVSEFDFRMIVI